MVSNKFNIFNSLLLKWLFDNGLINVTGNSLEAVSEWLKLSVDNMILFFAFFDVVAPTGLKGVSSIQQADTTSLILLLVILIINHYLGMKTLKLLLFRLEEQNYLPKWASQILELI